MSSTLVAFFRFYAALGFFSSVFYKASGELFMVLYIFGFLIFYILVLMVLVTSFIALFRPGYTLMAIGLIWLVFIAIALNIIWSDGSVDLFVFARHGLSIVSAMTFMMTFLEKQGNK